MRQHPAADPADGARPAAPALRRTPPVAAGTARRPAAEVDVVPPRPVAGPRRTSGTGTPRPEPGAARRTGPGGRPAGGAPGGRSAAGGSPAGTAPAGGSRAGGTPGAGTPGAGSPRVGSPRGGTVPRPGPRSGARRARLRPTPLGWAVLGVAAALVVVLVVGVVRLVSGPGDAAPACEPDATMSLNCWPAITDNEDPRLEPSPWITGRVLGGDVRTVLDHVAQRFDAEVEPVDVASSWGWAYRPVRGEDDALSNHASGTSIDLNATEHPLGSSGTFSDDQVAAIHAILAEVSPVVAWGGDFDGRRDEMHFEIVGDSAAVAEVAARLRGDAG